MAIFAVYDTTGIQDYIFASGKLSECRGASELVRSVFRDMLPNSLPEDSIIDWEERADKPLDINDINAPAEIVCAGGGNAYVVYRDAETFQDSTERCLRTVLEKTCGIGVAVAAVETDLTTDFINDYNLLQKRISETKGNINTTCLVGSQSITRISPLTGEPVSRIVQHHGDWQNISEGQHYKREADVPDGIEFDAMVETDNNYIGVIHADGNNMSDRIRKYATSECDWSKAVPRLRNMSKNITACFVKAYDQTKEVYDAHFNKAKKEIPPMIPLVTDGEDMTFFVPGRYAISVAAEYLRNVEALDIFPFGSDSADKLTACAGVTLFHSHFPVSRVYSTAEELCANAKGAARRENQRVQDISCLDFHIHASGFVTSITDFRRTHYPNLIDGKLYARPLCTTLDAKNQNMYNEFERFLKQIQHRDEYSRSKLKDIRAALPRIRDDDTSEVEMLVADLRLTEKLPNFSGSGTRTHKYAALNDALEIMDIFADISEGTKNAD